MSLQIFSDEIALSVLLGGFDIVKALSGELDDLMESLPEIKEEFDFAVYDEANQLLYLMRMNFSLWTKDIRVIHSVVENLLLPIYDAKLHGGPNIYRVASAYFNALRKYLDNVDENLFVNKFVQIARERIVLEIFEMVEIGGVYNSSKIFRRRSEAVEAIETLLQDQPEVLVEVPDGDSIDETKSRTLRGDRASLTAQQYIGTYSRVKVSFNEKSYYFVKHQLW